MKSFDSDDSFSDTSLPPGLLEIPTASTEGIGIIEPKKKKENIKNKQKIEEKKDRSIANIQAPEAPPKEVKDLSPAPLLLDSTDTPIPKKRIKKRHKKKEAAADAKSVKKAKKAKKLSKELKNPHEKTHKSEQKRVSNVEIQLSEIKQDSILLGSATPRPRKKSLSKAKLTSSEENLLKAGEKKKTLSNDAITTPKIKEKRPFDAKSNFSTPIKNRGIDETKSVRSPKRHKKLIDPELDAVVATPVLDVPEIKTNGLSMRASTKAALDILTGGLIPVPANELPVKVEKPLPLKTLADMTMTVDNKGNEFSPKPGRKRKSKRSSESKSDHMHPVDNWYAFQIEVIGPPDDTPIEEKATKDFDIIDLTKKVKE